MREIIKINSSIIKWGVMMKPLNFFLLSLFSFYLLFRGDIYPQCNTNDDLGYYEENNSNAIILHSHNTYTGGNCIGYAIAYTHQSYIGSVCGADTEIVINEAYAKNFWATWGFYTYEGAFNVNNTSGIQTDDI